MNTKEEITEFLEELAIGVQKKRNYLEEKVQQYNNELRKQQSQKTMDILLSFKLSLDNIEGQLYEINYILETINRKEVAMKKYKVQYVSVIEAESREKAREMYLEEIKDTDEFDTEDIEAIRV